MQSILELSRGFVTFAYLGALSIGLFFAIRHRWHWTMIAFFGWGLIRYVLSYIQMSLLDRLSRNGNFLAVRTYSTGFAVAQNLIEVAVFALFVYGLTVRGTAGDTRTGSRH